MLHWIFLTLLVLTTTPTPPPVLQAEGLSFTLAPELLALPADQAPFVIPPPDSLIALSARALVGAGYFENQAQQRGWRYWGVRGSGEGTWGEYSDTAWVIAVQPRRYDLSDWRSLPQVAAMINGDYFRTDVQFYCDVHYEQIAPRRLALPNGEALSAFYLCLSYIYSIGDGGLCGGTASEYHFTVWYTLHTVTTDDQLIVAYVPLRLDLPFLKLTDTTCYDEETETTNRVIRITGQEVLAWSLSNPRGNWEVAPWALPELIEEATQRISAVEADPMSRLAQARAALDATFSTLRLAP